MNPQNYIYVTGSSRGLGKALAERLIADGDWRITGISRNCSIEHPLYKHVFLNLTDKTQLLNFHFDPISAAKRVVLFNNAGTLGQIKYIGDMNQNMMIDAFMVNLVAPAVLTNKFIAQYKELSADKLIINISSGAAQTPYDGWGVYAPAKAGLDMLTKVIAEEQKLARIASPFKILSIAPGVIDTDMQKIIRQAENIDFSKKQKFIDLSKNNLLTTPQQAAEKYFSIINDPSIVKTVISRIEYN